MTGVGGNEEDLMNGLNMYMADGTYSGPIVMSSTASKFTAVRIKKMDLAAYSNELDGPAEQSGGLAKIKALAAPFVRKRIMNTHSGSIDSSWHTVVAFVCSNNTISTNELLFIENAMCEYTHANYPHCLTTNPSKGNCNAQYRNQHYHLSAGQIHACNHYISDIKFYISLFQPSIFPGGMQVTPQIGTKETFYFKSPTRDSDGTAEILVHCGHTGPREAILKAGSKVSNAVSDRFAGYQTVINQRMKLEAEGKLIARVLQDDVKFPSQSGAGQFLNGTSFNGNDRWKTAEGVPLKDLLE